MRKIKIIEHVHKGILASEMEEFINKINPVDSYVDKIYDIKFAVSDAAGRYIVCIIYEGD